MAKSGKLSPSNIAVWVIVLLLIVGLMGFGATSFGGRVESIGKVGNTEIAVTRYANALQQEMRRLEQTTGQRMTLSQVQAFGLDQAVLAQVVGLTALEDEAASLGLSAGDAVVRDEIVRIPAFQGLDGSFDREAYSYSLEQAGLNAAEYEATIRSETARTLLQGAVTGGVKTPSVLVDRLYAYARETRDLSWTVIGRDQLPEPIPAPTDADLTAYYEAHPDAFSLPERRRITYTWVTPDMLIADVDVSDDTLRRLYEDRIDEFVLPERRLVERLVFGTEAEATSARAAIEAGETSFDELVADRGLDLSDIDLGDVTRNALGDAAEAVFALDAPGIAGPAMTPLGPALFRMNGILAARETGFDEARGLLRDDAAHDAARRRIADAREPLDDLLASGATLEELADETDMVLGEVLWSPEVSDGIAGYEAFATAAGTVAESDFPELIDLSDGGLLALRLDEIVPAAVQPYEDVEIAVIEAWDAAEAAAAIRARAEALTEALSGGATPEDEGLVLTGDTGASRDGFLEGAPLDLVTTAFAMTEGEWRKIDTPEGAVLVRLDAIHPAADDDEAQAIKAAFSDSTAQGYAQDLLDAYTRATQADAGLTLDRAAINAVHAQFP